MNKKERWCNIVIKNMDSEIGLLSFDYQLYYY